MEGPFQLGDSVIDAVINNMGPAVFLLRRIEETPNMRITVRLSVAQMAILWGR